MQRLFVGPGTSFRLQQRETLIKGLLSKEESSHKQASQESPIARGAGRSSSLLYFSHSYGKAFAYGPCSWVQWCLGNRKKLYFKMDELLIDGCLHGNFLVESPPPGAIGAWTTPSFHLLSSSIHFCLSSSRGSLAAFLMDCYSSSDRGSLPNTCHTQPDAR